ncbi:MAG TPA: sugar phosphate isomerase/epimerase [Chloroflexota bacterium]|nr:sugar phosphate isomerase/epimerase [Chloroflexota bacterium]
MARVACSPAGWHGHGLSFERILDGVADTGYAGVEANRQAFETFSQEVPRLRALLAERTLRLTAGALVATFFDKDELPAERLALRRVGDFMAEVNEGAIVLFRTPQHPARRDMVAGEPPLLPLSVDRLGRLADTLNEFGDRCRDWGLIGAVQNRVGTYLETPDEYTEVIQRTDPALVWLAPDLGHWTYAGGDVESLIALERQRIVYPRLKGFDHSVFETIAAERLGFTQFVQSDGFPPLDEGTLDLEAALMPFEKAEFGGWVCVELDPGSVYADDPRACAQRSREFLRSRLHW